MTTPLRDRILVELEEAMPNCAVFIPTNVTKWRESRDQISNRAKVVAVGAGKRHPKTGTIIPNCVKPGDFVRFSELIYPTLTVAGVKCALIMNADIVGIEQ